MCKAIKKINYIKHHVKLRGVQNGKNGEIPVFNTGSNKDRKNHDGSSEVAIKCYPHAKTGTHH